MKVLPRYWADCVSTDFSDMDLLRTVAVLPLGATEQHGPHLPLSVDTDLVNAMEGACRPVQPMPGAADFVRRIAVISQNGPLVVPCRVLAPPIFRSLLLLEPH